MTLQSSCNVIFACDENEERTSQRSIASSVYRLKYGRADNPGAAMLYDMARYRKTGRSKLLPLKVTSWGFSSAILSTNAWINSFSVLSRTWGAPRASIAQHSDSRRAISAPMQTME